MLSPNTHRVWKNHKYIRKEGNRYIYPEDLKRMQRSRDGKLIRTITDANGNKIQVRGSAATNTIVNRSNRYDRASGERFSPTEYRTRMQDGSLDRMRGQVVQEAAKKQGQYSLNMMRQEKRTQAVNNQGTVNYKQLSQQKAVSKIPRQTMTSTPANLRNKTQQTSSQNVNTAAKQAMERAGYNGPAVRPQNQHVAQKKKTEEKKTETTKTEEKKSSLLSSLNDTKEEDNKKTSKSSSTKSSSGSSSSGSSKSSGNSGSSSSSGSSKSSSSSGSTKENKGTVTTPVGVYRGGTSSSKASSSKKSSKSSKGGSGSNASSSDADMELNKNNEEKTKAEELDNILQENMDLKTMSESSIKSIADKLGDVLDIGKTESKIQGRTKLSDAKSLVSRGLSILKSFKSK